jgi:nitric oxide dioxygenase
MTTTQQLSLSARPLIAASVPVLREYGLAITRHFYARMFQEHPELLNLFNQGNQASGAQQGSLAAAVLAYAANIDNPSALAPVIERIAHKHASIGIEPAHYAIVGRHLLAAIAEVLGEAATPALLLAWEEAYWLLANDLTSTEARLYREAASSPGEFRELTVSDVQRETDEATSYYLQARNGASPGSFVPGQYVSVAVDLPSGFRQMRQYSLSDAPGRPHWRITVKREPPSAHSPAGQVSNWLHANVRRGDELRVSRAYGNFMPRAPAERPLALLSAGVGLTPMVAVLNALVDEEHAKPVLFAHAARSSAHLSLQRDVLLAGSRLPKLSTLLFLEDANQPSLASATSGRMLLAGRIEAFLDADFFLCGPLGFMREQWRALTSLGVSVSRIQREVFGPDLLDHLA